MKKFFSVLLVLIVLLGGLATYFFLANDKMMWHVVKSDSSALATDLNKAIKKVHEYGNFDISFDYVDKDGKKIHSDLLIKFDGENRYFSATSTSGEKTTSYYCEALSTSTSLYKDDGEYKSVNDLISWEKALGLVTTGLEVYPECLRTILNNDVQISEENFVEKFKSSTIVFNLSPLYYGAKAECENDEGTISYEISNRGILRKFTIEIKDVGTQTLFLNNPGKEVKINSLTAEQKAEYTPSI